MDILKDAVLMLLLFLFCYWVSGVVHELGHIIVGLLHGWKFWMLVVGPLGLKKTDNKIAVYFEKNIVMWAGVGGTLPSDESADNIKIWSKILLGGPATSIIMGLVFLLLNLVYPSIVFLMLGAMPLGMGVACLLPLKTGITYSDGKRWLRLRSEGQEQAEEIAIFKMMMLGLFNKDFSAIKLDDFSSLLNAKNPALKYYGYYYLYQYYDARNDDENKLNALETLQGMKPSVSAVIIDDCGL